MAKLVFAMNMFLDGYVDHKELGPAPGLFRHFIEDMRGLTGLVYGRGLYEVMRYWDDDLPDWDEEERKYAEVWRRQPKWVVSRSLKLVDPNATLVSDDIEKVNHARTVSDLSTQRWDALHQGPQDGPDGQTIFVGSTEPSHL